jgi:Fe-S cluster assembly protein SufD
MKALKSANRQDENWRGFCWSRLNWSNYESNKQKSRLIHDAPKRDNFDALVFVDGIFSESLSDHKNFQSGFLMSITEDKVLLRVSSGLKIKKPIQVLQITSKASEKTKTTMAFSIILEPEASLNLWFDNWSADKTEYVLIDQKVELELKDRSVCEVIVCQKEQGVQRLSSTHCIQSSLSRFQWFYLGLETDWTREELRLDLKGVKTETRLRGLMCPTAKQYMALHTLLEHDALNTHAEQTVRSIVSEQGVAQFQGRVLVKPGACKTHSTQSCKTLLLDKTAEARSCPQLEIYADDVICNHGASVGELQDDQLFYLKSRGIGLMEAKKLLLQGFAEAVIAQVSDLQFRDLLLATFGNQGEGKSHDL